MNLKDLLEKLMYLDEQTCPCEVGIPCKYRAEETEYDYCVTGACLDGVAFAVRQIVKEENN